MARATIPAQASPGRSVVSPVSTCWPLLWPALASPGQPGMVRDFPGLHSGSGTVRRGAESPKACTGVGVIFLPFTGLRRRTATQYGLRPETISLWPNLNKWMLHHLT